MRYFKINNMPGRALVSHNQVTWDKVLKLPKVFSEDAFLKAAGNHQPYGRPPKNGDKKAAARGFLDYCIRNGWVIEV